LVTVGIDHVGLTVKNVASARRFLRVPRWKVISENQSYPATFISNGNAGCDIAHIKLVSRSYDA
jgi:hypothetical protein